MCIYIEENIPDNLQLHYPGAGCRQLVQAFWKIVGAGAGLLQEVVETPRQEMQCRKRMQHDNNNDDGARLT